MLINGWIDLFSWKEDKIVLGFQDILFYSWRSQSYPTWRNGLHLLILADKVEYPGSFNKQIFLTFLFSRIYFSGLWNKSTLSVDKISNEAPTIRNFEYHEIKKSSSWLIGILSAGPLRSKFKSISQKIRKIYLSLNHSFSNGENQDLWRYFTQERS
mgnify:CR=1 FL=1